MGPGWTGAVPDGCRAAGLAWLGALLARPPAAGLAPAPALALPVLAARRAALVGGCLLARPECLITMVRKRTPQPPSLLACALPPVNCHAEAIRAAFSSRAAAGRPLALLAKGWLVIDRLGEGARRDATPGQGSKDHRVGPLGSLEEDPPASATEMAFKWFQTR